MSLALEHFVSLRDTYLAEPACSTAIGGNGYGAATLCGRCWRGGGDDNIVQWVEGDVCGGVP